MPHLLDIPLDHDPKHDPDWVLAGSLQQNIDPAVDLPRLRVAPPSKPQIALLMLFADCCYIVTEASLFLMACWITALGLPMMLVLLMSGGHMDMALDFLSSLFGAFFDATPDRRYAFASSATWVLIGLVTVIAAWRLPRFLTKVTKSLDAWKQVS